MGAVTHANDYYDDFYARGGWHYNLGTEATFLRRIIIPLAGWDEGEFIYEIGAGNCHHSELIRKMGYRVVAVEASSEACAMASKTYPYLTIVNADAYAWCPPLYRGHVFARGMSWWHYELSGVNRKGVNVDKVTARIFSDWMRSGDTFTLQIITNFSGKVGAGGVLMNKPQEYQKLFGKFGDTKVYDWSGKLALNKRPFRGVIVVTTKE